MSMIYMLILLLFIIYINNLDNDKCVLKLCSMGCIILLLLQNKMIEPSEATTEINKPEQPQQTKQQPQQTKQQPQQTKQQPQQTKQQPQQTKQQPQQTKQQPQQQPQQTKQQPQQQPQQKNKLDKNYVKTRTFDDVVNETVGPTIPAPNISKYDGLCLKNDNNEGWMKYPNDVPLLDDKDLFVIQGFTNPLDTIFSDNTQIDGPSVDGGEDSSKSLFMFKNNVVSPLCCPSTFSTSSGCVCTTEKQRNYVNNKGYGNKNLCLTD
uniref:Uncharacterized protein n=1 Tax=viral metagenome TaxID=1070528 RepID=A0A6C0CZ24_9ZZZZ